MVKTEIGNRGSKSIIIVNEINKFVIIVKEQWVDGSWWEKFSNIRPFILYKFYPPHLRSTLLDFKRNYQVY